MKISGWKPSSTGFKTHGRDGGGHLVIIAGGVAWGNGVACCHRQGKDLCGVCEV